MYQDIAWIKTFVKIHSPRGFQWGTHKSSDCRFRLVFLILWLELLHEGPIRPRRRTYGVLQKQEFTRPLESSDIKFTLPSKSRVRSTCCRNMLPQIRLFLVSTWKTNAFSIPEMSSLWEKWDLRSGQEPEIRHHSLANWHQDRLAPKKKLTWKWNENLIKICGKLLQFPCSTGSAIKLFVLVLQYFFLLKQAWLQLGSLQNTAMASTVLKKLNFLQITHTILQTVISVPSW